MFDFILEDDGIVHRLKELKDYYKQKDEREEKKSRRIRDSLLKKVFKVYPGM